MTASSAAAKKRSRRTRLVDGDALLPLFERHHEAVWRFALRMTGDSDRARDLVQETFTRALGRRLPVDERRAEAWLMRTLVNLVRDDHRRRRVRLERRGEAAAIERRATDPESAAVARATVARLLARLAPRRRAVVVLVELGGNTVRETARRLGMARATVRWHLATARRELRRALTESEERGP